MPITSQQLLQILPNAGPVAGVFAPVLNTAAGRYSVEETQSFRRRPHGTAYGDLYTLRHIFPEEAAA
jgi:hypothetical protein